MRQYVRLATLLAAITLSACGTKGPLTQIPKPATPAVPTIQTPQPAPASDNLNTAKDPAR